MARPSGDVYSTAVLSHSRKTLFYKTTPKTTEDCASDYASAVYPGAIAARFTPLCDLAV